MSLGLAFSFGAKDNGLSAAFDRTVAGMRKMFGLMDAQEDLAKKSSMPDMFNKVNKEAKKTNTIFTDLGAGLAKLNISSIDQQMKALAGEGISGVSDELDAFGAQVNKSVRKAGAQIGLTGKELAKVTGQISGWAYSTNIDSSVFVENMEAMREAGVKVTDVFGSGATEKDFAKLVDVTGQGGKFWVGLFTGLTRGWGFTDKQAQSAVNTFVSAAQAAGVGSEAAKQLSSVMETVNEQYSYLGAAATPERISKATKEVALLAGAIKSGVGGSSEDAFKASNKLFLALSTEAANAQKRLRATGDFAQGGLAHTLMELVGDHDKALEIMNQGPLEFAKIIRGYVENTEGMTDAQRNNVMRMKDLLQQQLGSDFRYMLDVSSEHLTKFDGAVLNSQNALMKMAKAGHSTGLTLQESLDRSALSFRHKLKGIVQPEINAFVKNQRQAYSAAGKSIQQLSEGPMGGLVKKLLEVRVVGMRAFLPMDGRGEVLSQLATGAVEASTALAPLTQVLTAMGPVIGKAISGLGGLLKFFPAMIGATVGWPVAIAGAIAAAIGGLIVFWPEVKKQLEGGAKWLGESLFSADEWVKSVDPVRIADSIIGALGDVAGAVESWVTGSDSEASGGIYGALFGNAKSLASNIGSKLVEFKDALIPKFKEFVANLDVAEMLKSANNRGMALMGAIGDWFASVDWVGGFKEVWDAIPFGKIFEGFKTVMFLRLKMMKAGAVGVLGLLRKVFKFAGDTESITKWIQDSVFGGMSFGEFMADALRFDSDSSLVSDIGSSIFNTLAEAFETIKPAEILEALADTFATAVDGLAAWIDELDLDAIADGIQDGIFSMIDSLTSDVGQDQESQGKLQSAFTRFFKSIDWAKVGNALSKAALASGKLALSIGKLSLKTLWFAFKTIAFKARMVMAKFLKKMAIKAWENLKEDAPKWAQRLFDGIKGAIASLNTKLPALVERVKAGLQEHVVKPIIQKFSEMKNRLSNWVEDTFSGPFEDALAFIKGFGPRLTLDTDKGFLEPLLLLRDRFKSAAKRMLDGLKEGLIEGWKTVRAFVVRIGGAVFGDSAKVDHVIQAEEKKAKENKAARTPSTRGSNFRTQGNDVVELLEDIRAHLSHIQTATGASVAVQQRMLSKLGRRSSGSSRAPGRASAPVSSPDVTSGVGVGE